MLRRLAMVLLVFSGAMLPRIARGAGGVVCKEADSKTEYKIDVKWGPDTAVISMRQGGTGAWRKIYEGATAVRNGATDLAMLVEGTAVHFVGGYDGKCGKFIDILAFDLKAVGGKRVGTVTKTPIWAVAGGAPNTKCKAETAAPELAPIVVDVSCN